MNPLRWAHLSRTILGLALLCLASLLGLVNAADAAAQSAPPAPHIGSLTIRDAFLPQPASSSVASIYLTVKNSGSQADELIGVHTAAAAGSMLMTEDANGSMGMLRDLRIPAHGQASLTPGRDHLMLEQPHHSLKLGQHVAVTLRFKRAGSLTISVPVVPLSRILSRG